MGLRDLTLLCGSNECRECAINSGYVIFPGLTSSACVIKSQLNIICSGVNMRLNYDFDWICYCFVITVIIALRHHIQNLLCL